jgi:hypothetical protein
MGMHFSPSLLGFYADEVHGTKVPADAVPVTAGRHAELMAAQASGSAIAAGRDGEPCAVAREQPEREVAP